MKYIITALLILFTALPVWSQITEKDLRKLKRGVIVDNYGPSYEVEGSPLYHKNWQRGLVFMATGKVSNIHKLKFNILTNKLHLQKKGVAYTVNPNIIDGFAFVKDGNRTIFKKGFKSDKYDIDTDNFVQVIYERKIKLIKQLLIDVEKNLSVFSGEKTIRLDSKKFYYLITADGSFHEVEPDRDDILEALGKYRKQLEKYAEKNHLSFEEETDLKKILAQYDSLNAASLKLN